jgi:5-(carboxyamino)imidazole ribonucleotide synthase
VSEQLDERPAPPPAGEPAGAAIPSVGMVGAGQLARMTCPAAAGLAIGFRVLAAAADDSAAKVWPDVRLGDYRSLADLRGFAAGCDVVTFDHEHVPGPHLAALEEAGVVIRPGADALRYTQDKLAMRERLTALGVACPRYAPVRDLGDIERFAEQRGWPVVLKAVSGGYDGKGVWVCASPGEAAEVAGLDLRLLAEEYVSFDRELAALVARSPHRQGAAYPVVQTVQRDGICREVLAPAPGLLAPQVVLANLLGGTDPDVYDRYIHVMAADPGLKVHLYGKAVRRGRKIGHVTVLGDDVAELRDRARRAASFLRWGTEDGD